MLPDQLPIYNYKEDLVHAIHSHGLLIVVGETGSGKTTQLPQYILLDDPKASIVVTQPRRIAAISNSRRVSHEMQSKLGSTVGYVIRFEAVVSEKTRIRYVTDGVLLREIIDDPVLSNYSHIVIDESHERTVGTDILLGLLKRCISMRRDVKIIIMSATLDVEKFSDFFHECPIFQIPGRPFPVEIMYAREVSLTKLRTTYYDRALDTAFHIHMNDKPGDILVFLCGSEEIDRAVHESRLRNDEIDYRQNIAHSSVTGLQVFAIYSSLETIDQRSVFEPLQSGLRKIVFATNIAQTSLTIPGIVYVVDNGFVKQKSYDPITCIDALLIEPISKAAATQRAGRAGRTQPGKAYRLYSHKSFNEEFDEETIPEIQRTSLINTVLCLKETGVDDVLHFDFVDPPDTKLVQSALRQLYFLGALDNDGHVTEIGHRIAHMPLSPYLSRAVYAAASDFGCVEEVVIISAMLSVDQIWNEPRGRRAQDDKYMALVRKKWDSFKDVTGDHLTYLNVYNAWQESGYSQAWCRDFNIHTRSLNQARNIRAQLHTLVSQWNLPILVRSKKSEIDPVPILKSMCAAYYSNLAKRQPNRPYFYQYAVNRQSTVNHPTTDSALLALTLHSTSTLNQYLSVSNKCELEWIIYHDIVLTNRAHMRHCSRIWHWDWVEPYLDRLELVNSAQLSGKSMLSPSTNAPIPFNNDDLTNVTPESTSNSERDVELCEKQNRDRALIISAAKERALKRRKVK